MADESRPNRGPALLRDLFKALLIGLAASAAGFALLFLGGFLSGAGDGRILRGLEAAKDGLLIVSALGLFILAGMILVKGKKGDAPVADGWRRHFKIAGYKSVLAVICAALAMAACVADYLLLSA